jgi:hypothetical protein
MRLKKIRLLAMIPLLFLSTGLHAGNGGDGGNGSSCCRERRKWR